MDQVVDAVRAVPGLEVLDVVDRTFELHDGGKIEVLAHRPIADRDDLSMAYTPGVARVCRAIADEPEPVHDLTIKGNTVAIVTDGTAVLGLGDIGPEAALPVMEGKALLFKEFAGVDAFPICLDVRATRRHDARADADRRGRAAHRPGLRRHQPRGHRRAGVLRGRGAAAGAARHPRLPRRPARHRRRRPRRPRERAAGRRQADGRRPGRHLRRRRRRRRHRQDPHGRRRASRSSAATARAPCTPAATTSTLEAVVRREHQPRRLRRHASAEALAGADVFVGVSAPDLITPDDVASMAKDPIVFAMANPDPEIRPELIRDIAAVIATGRSDYPNQINNVLAFPGIFRGALDARATEITEGMKLAAADAIARAVSSDDLAPDYIIPSVFDRGVVELVAPAVAAAARAEGFVRT